MGVHELLNHLKVRDGARSPFQRCLTFINLVRIFEAIPGPARHADRWLIQGLLGGP